MDRRDLLLSLAGGSILSRSPLPPGVPDAYPGPTPAAAGEQNVRDGRGEENRRSENIGRDGRPGPAGGIAGAVSVEALGAAGDGHTDDTEAVQQALDMLTGDTKMVQFGAGRTYAVRNLVIPDTDRVTLAGNGAVLKKLDGGDDEYVIASRNYLDDTRYGQKPIRILMLAVDADNRARYGLVHQAWNSDIIGCEFRNARRAGLMVTANTRSGHGFQDQITLVNNRILNCRMLGNGWAGLWVRDSQRNRATDLLIRDCFVYDNASFGMRLDTSGGTQITGSHFYTNADADLDIGYAWGGGNISGCYFESATSIRIHSGQHPATVVNCWIRGALAVHFDATFGRTLSMGNQYFGDGHLLILAGDADTGPVSTADMFETDRPFRWQEKAGRGRVVAHNSYADSGRILLNGDFRAG